LQFRPTTQSTFAALLLAISILSLTPTLVRATQQNPSYPVTINATGQATAVGPGPSGATSLKLAAIAYKNTDNWLIIQNTTGTLTISSTPYQLTGGQGSVNQYGDIAIFADTDSGRAQLILHGTSNGNAISFTPPSELASIAYLSLTGTLTQDTEQAASSTVGATTTFTNASTKTATNQTQANNFNIISTSTSSHAQNTTEANANMTSTSYATLPATTSNNANSTTNSVAAVPLTQTISETNSTSVTNMTSTSATEMIGSNATQSTTLNGNVSAAVAQASGNVTFTQYLTISTTQTVANTTINYTATTTVANITLSQATVITTVANTTVTQANVTATVTATTGA